MAMFLLRLTTACLEEEYAAPELPEIPATEETLMMLPHPCFSIWRKTSRQQ